MSQKNRISVTRALSELGMIGSRIAMAIASGTFVSVVRGAAKKPAIGTFATAAELDNHITACFNSVEGLIARQADLKAAVIKSNAETEVTIANKKMTVAEAINQKAVATHRQSFLSALRRQMSACLLDFNNSTEKLDQQIERQIQAIYNTGKEKATAEQYSVVATPLKQEYAPYIVSTKGDLNAYIREYEKELNDFLAECDYILSESNSLTFIEV